MFINEGPDKILNVTAPFNLISTQEPVLNFTTASQDSINVTVGQSFPLSCQAVDGQPIPIG